MNRPAMSDADMDAALEKHFQPARYKAAPHMDYTPHWYVPRGFDDTVPTDHAPMPTHAASEVHDDDVCKKGEGSGPFVVPLVIVSACLSAAALWHFVAWVWP